MTDSTVPERQPRQRNGAALVIGILVAGLVAGVFILKQSAGDAAVAPLAGPATATNPALSQAPSSPRVNPSVSPAPTSPGVNSTAPGEDDYVAGEQRPGPLPDNEEPPEEYDACVAWYESYGYNADNCPSPDPELESLMADAAQRVEAAQLPLPSPSVSPRTPTQINIQRCRVYLHSLSEDPDDCLKIPDIEYVDADLMFGMEHGCDRDPRDKPGVVICDGPGGSPDPDGDGGIDSVKTFIRADWSIDADFYGAGDDDSRGLDWRGGEIVVELTTEARATWISITDQYGHPLAPAEDAQPSKALRATLPAGRYIVRTGTYAKSGSVPYRLTAKAG